MKMSIYIYIDRYTHSMFYWVLFKRINENVHINLIQYLTIFLVYFIIHEVLSWLVEFHINHNGSFNAKSSLHI